MILVTGATGVVGREVVAQLLDAGQDVRVLTRDADHALPLGPQVKVVTGDLGVPESLAPALAGVEQVFLLTGGGPETPLHDANLAEAALTAGVRHIVKLSIIGAEYGFQDLVSSWHLAGERAVAQVGERPDGPAWTFLRPGEFMSNARLWAAPIKARDTVFWPHGDVEVAVIDPRDVACAAVTALTTSGHEGRTYRIGGPEALSTAARVEKLAAALGRPLRLVDVSIADARDGAVRAGRQALVVETTLGNLGRPEFQQHARKVLPAYTELTGKAPRTFDQWTADHLHLFR